MQTRSRALLPLVLLVARCSHQPSTSAPPPSTPPPSASTPTRPIPTDLIVRVEQSQLLGRAIYLQNLASAVGTDVAVAGGGLDARTRGWVTQDLGDGRWSVQFVMPEGDGFLATQEVRIWGKSRELETFSPPRSLSPGAEAMFRARQAALAQVQGPCLPPYNTVVLPASLIGESGWLVYVLASSNQPDTYVLAGHHRFRLSDDGRAVLAHMALSRSCLISDLGDQKGKVVALTMNQIVADWPLETVVFSALLYWMPIYVATERGTWNVDQGSITYLRE
jgi:hypothetical protein